MALVMLALPGSVFVYNGEELGLPNVDLPDEVLQDPVWERSGRTSAAATAAGCRCRGVGRAPPFGFSSSPDTWLPMPADWSSLTVEAQPASRVRTLTLYRRAIHCAGTGRAEFTGDDQSSWLC